ncbi:hypothetical protein [Enterovibrio calviensis]|uniref:hypothetical protein n=1 Tax=Enterovibrio calviensis TaxID=91359 RepID=UPI003735617E
MTKTDSSNRPFRDLTFFVSSVMAALFSVGYIYETTYLEVFGLNNSEILPEPSISIVYGFRYALLNGLSNVFSIALIVSLMLAFFSVIKNDIQKAISKSAFIKQNFNWVVTMSEKESSPIGFYVGLVVLFCALSMHAIFEGKSLGERIKSEKVVECLMYVDTQRTPLEGNMIRVRDGLVAFWESSSENDGVTRLITQRNVLETRYGKCPNKNLNPDA